METDDLETLETALTHLANAIRMLESHTAKGFATAVDKDDLTRQIRIAYGKVNAVWGRNMPDEDPS